METLRRQVRRARRRLVLQAFVGKWAWCSFVALVLATLAIGGIKFWPPADERAWELGLGGHRNSVPQRSPRRSGPGWELKRRCKRPWKSTAASALKERVSSALALDPEHWTRGRSGPGAKTPRRRIEAIDVAEQFGVRLRSAGPCCRWRLPPWPARWPCSSTAAGPWSRPWRQPPRALKSRSRPRRWSKKIDEGRKEAQEHGLTDADALLKQLEQGTKAWPTRRCPTANKRWSR